MRVVIIGAGAAGISAVETIRRYDVESEVTVISRERSLPYSPVSLPDYIEGRISKEQIFVWNDHLIKENEVDFIYGKEVVYIHPNKQLIQLDDDSVISYDKLLIATGASPILTKDLDRMGVFTLRTLEDAESIRHQIKERVIIYGGGAVATKIATALKKIGIDVIVFCRSRMLRRLFDEDICQLIQDLLVANGIKLVGVHDQVQIIGDPVERLRIGTQELNCDGVIAALGVSPNTSFLDDKLIRLGSTKGIIVNESMETSVVDVYAAGDCTETRDVISGEPYVMALLPPAVEQGKVAALNMIGINTKYEGTLSQNMIDVFDTPFASIGSLEGDKIDIKKQGIIKRVTLKKGKIIGAQLVGDVGDAGIISSVIKNGSNINDLYKFRTVPYRNYISMLYMN